MYKSPFQCHGKSPKLADDNRPKDKEREELAALMNEWLSNGNKVEVVSSTTPVDSRHGR